MSARTKPRWRAGLASLAAAVITCVAATGLAPIAMAQAASSPVAPTLTSLEVAGTGKLTYELAHDGAEGDYLYRVFWKSDDQWTQVGDYTGPAAESVEVVARHASILNNQVSEVAVQACVPGDASTCSPSQVVGPVAVSVPYALHVTIDGSAATVHWSYADPAGGSLDRFELYMRSPGQQWRPNRIADAAADQRSATVTMLRPNTAYEIGVRALQYTDGSDVASTLVAIPVTVGASKPILPTTTHPEISTAPAEPRSRHPRAQKPVEDPAPPSPSPDPDSEIEPAPPSEPNPEPEPQPEPEPEPELAVGGWDAQRARFDAGATTSFATPTGNELHVGAGQSFATITDAVAAAAAGDWIVLHDGVYRESMGANRGYLTRPLNFIAAPGERPVVSGADPVVGWRRDGAQWYHQYSNDHFELTEPTSAAILPEQLAATNPAAGHLEQLFVNGQPWAQRRFKSDVDQAGEFWIDRATDRIHVAVDIALADVEASSRDRALYVAPGAAGSSVIGITVTAFSPEHLDGKAAIVIAGADNVELTDTVVTHSAAAGVSAVRRSTELSGLRLTRVTFDDNGSRGLHADGLTDAVIEYSRFDDNNRAGFDHLDCGGGTYCVLAGAKITGSRQLVVRYSSFQRNQATGLWCDLDCRDTVVVGSVFADNAKHGLYYEISSTATIAGNLLVGHEAGNGAIKLSGAVGVDVHRNTFYDNTTAIIAAADGRQVLAPGNADDIDVAANVFVETSAPATPQFLLDPRTHHNGEGGNPLPSSRVTGWDHNAYVLTSGDPGGLPRFGWDAAPNAASTPADFSSMSALESTWLVVVSTDPRTAFVDWSGHDYRIADTTISAFGATDGAPLPTAAIGPGRWSGPSTVGVGAPMWSAPSSIG